MPTSSASRSSAPLRQIALNAGLEGGVVAEKVARPARRATASTRPPASTATCSPPASRPDQGRALRAAERRVHRGAVPDDRGGRRGQAREGCRRWAATRRAAWAAWTSDPPVHPQHHEAPAPGGGLVLSGRRSGLLGVTAAVTACGRGSGGAGAGADGGGAARGVEPRGQGRRPRTGCCSSGCTPPERRALWVPVGVVWVVVTGDRPQWVWLGAAALSAALHIGYQLALQRGYAEGELNVVYPLARGTGPLLTFVVAVDGARRATRSRGRGRACSLVVGGVLLISCRPARATATRWPGVALGTADRRDHRGVHAVGQPRGHRPRRVAGAVLRARTVCQVPVLTSDGPAPDPRRTAGLARAGPAGAGGGAAARRSPTSWCCGRCSWRPVALVAAARESSIVVGALFGWLVLQRGPAAAPAGRRGRRRWPASPRS